MARITRLELDEEFECCLIRLRFQALDHFSPMVLEQILSVELSTRAYRTSPFSRAFRRVHNSACGKLACRKQTRLFSVLLVAGVVVGWLVNGCFLFVRTIADMTGYRPLLMQEFSWRDSSVEGSVLFALLSVVYAAIAAIFRESKATATTT
jgi:hypothetical protein